MTILYNFYIVIKITINIFMAVLISSFPNIKQFFFLLLLQQNKN